MLMSNSNKNETFLSEIKFNDPYKRTKKKKSRLSFNSGLLLRLPLSTTLMTTKNQHERVSKITILVM